MSLRDVKYKAQYVSGVDNLVRDFYVPTLSESILYQRRTAYFNSRALAMAARGLSGLLASGGKMQLLCSVQLDRSEEVVLKDPVAYLERHSEAVLDMLHAPYDELERRRLGLLAHLISSGQLEIRIAIRRGGIYHEKAGIFRDAADNIVAFNGSGNETPGGWVNNTESFHVFTSWEDDRHIQPEISTFDRLWNGRDPGTTVIPLPFAVVKGLIEFKDYFQEGWDEPIDPGEVGRPQSTWEWTPELLYVFEAPRLWNHHDFAYAETAVIPHEHQDYIASTVLEQWPPRYLFADEVGLGKTIEVGLVIKGFLASGRIDRLLYLAPSNTLKQLQGEFLTKFNLETWRLDGESVIGPQVQPDIPPIKEKVDAANPFRSKPVMLVSSQLIRSDERRAQLLELEYDMVVLDEAHHARARGPGGRREPNKLLEVMEELRYQTQGFIMMTATPIQLSRMELWDLLDMLELPGRWQSETAFDNFFATLNADDVDWAFVLDMCESHLEAYGVDDAAVRDLIEDFPRIDVYRLVHIMRNKEKNSIGELSDEERTALKVLLYRHTPIHRMVFRHTRELLKRYLEQGKFSGKIAERRTHKETVVLSGSPDDPRSERGLYDRIDRYVRDFYAKYNTVRKGLGFVMEIYRKRLTSSMHAIRLSLTKRHARLQEALQTGDFAPLVSDIEDEDLLDMPTIIYDEFGSSLVDPSQPSLESFSRSMRSIVQAEYDYLSKFIHDLEELPNDSKCEHLRDVFSTIFASGGRQVIVFSQFKDTVDFLLDYFRPMYGRRLGSYTGEGGVYWDGERWARCSKQDIQNRFVDPNDQLDILICTDAASEGLNLQSCSNVINYDIPWNPMRIEQRIGRIDRIGQESPIVDVYAFFYTGSVEEKAYNRCLERIDYFKSALGHLQPILEATERIIRKAALAATPEEELEAIESIEVEIDESVPQVEENLQIERLLNHYSPRLPMMSQRAPVTQSELEEALTPLLEKAGWIKQERIWHRDSKKVTFDQKLLDRKGGGVELVTPQHNLTNLVGIAPEISESSMGKGDLVLRMEVEGMTGFAMNVDGSYYIVRNLQELRTLSPSGESYRSSEEVLEGLRYLIRERRRKFLESELKAWRNRLRNWEVRTRMYLERLAKWRWETATKVEGLDLFSHDSLLSAWYQYLDHPERQSTKELAQLVQYRPEFDPGEKKRGRPSKRSPRDGKKESLLLNDYRRITKRINLIEAQYNVL